ncbi:nuclear transport factor 2 family protein [Rhizobium mongolense]|uniref:nuclear transport factor 2 family protein n=1 Tax=Rhizobium mongolense TaxID=57676 RepID=UPI0035592ED4
MQNSVSHCPRLQPAQPGNPSPQRKDHKNVGGSFPHWIGKGCLLSELPSQSDATISYAIEVRDQGRAICWTEIVDIQVLPLSNSIFAVSWQEKDRATVTNIQDYDRGLIYSYATLPGGQFLRMTGTFAFTRPADRVFDDRPQRNKALVLEAMTSLFQRHDASAVERLYAPDYIQHNPNIPQGRDALQALVADLSPAVYYEPGLIVAEGDFVAIHGRIRGWADESQVVIDLFRVEGGKLAEHCESVPMRTQHEHASVAMLI